MARITGKEVILWRLLVGSTLLPMAISPAFAASNRDQKDNYQEPSVVNSQDVASSEEVGADVSAQPINPDGLIRKGARGRSIFDSLRLQFGGETSCYGNSNSAIERLPECVGELRRAVVGFDLELSPDLTFSATYNFAGTGPQGLRHFRTLFLQYDGPSSTFVTLGVYSPPSGLSADTSGARSLFGYRDSITNVFRGIASGSGRKAATIGLHDKDWFVAISATFGKLGAPSTVPRQHAIVARASRLLFESADARALISLGFARSDRSSSGASVPDLGSELSDGPESSAGGVELVSTGSIATSRIDDWMLESAFQWRNAFLQVGYSHIRLQPALKPKPLAASLNANFKGWYIQGSWVLTGEPKRMSGDQTFVLPIPRNPVPDGPGAWELVLRQSVIDLNSQAGGAGTTTPPDGMRGGRQQVFSLGLNWYPTVHARVYFDYQKISVRRLSFAGLENFQSADALTLGAIFFL